MSLKNIGKSLSGIGKNLSGFLFGKPGGTNPFSPPDIATLMKNNPYLGLLGKYKSETSPIFDDLIKSIGSLNEAEDPLFQSLLTDIDKDTASAQGTLISDMAERGLVGPGQSSDIYSNAAATLAGEGVRRRSDARSKFAIDKATRLSNAYQNKFNQDSGIFSSLLGQEASGTSGRDVSLANLMAELYGVGEQNKKKRTPGFFDKFATSAADNFIKTATDPETLMKLVGLGA
ncbi:MAG: hypothetical protein EKK55_17455 [Rhodocyclaceae bacterium]|nr:MAG: hypothetical protein EKK55_17455 [Rhodocyclaceae bacterium]